MNCKNYRDIKLSKMRISLCMMYWSLLLTSLISSCLLFLIVASETIRLEEINASETPDRFVRDSKQPGAVTVAAAAEPPPVAVENEPPPPQRLPESVQAVSYVKKSDSDSKELNVPKSGFSDSVQDVVEEQQPPPPPPVDEIRTDDERFVEKDGQQMNKRFAERIENIPLRLSDIPVTPAVITLSEKTTELILDPIDENAENEIIPSPDAINQTENDDSTEGDRQIIQDEVIILPEPKTVQQETILPHEIPPDERTRKIDDSGGTILPESVLADSKEGLSIQDNETSTSTIPLANTRSSSEVNITVEENPIPVFSEWAQKQMEEAEKKLEKEAVNSSSMRKNATTGSKPQQLKLRAKNYASPDCGAKIIASNAEAQNTGALLTASKDEYMLSPCTNRIWFVVELCEAIQAEKIDLANFELFSSSPKNFSVAVSNRFPTREWSNVGRFVADDQRNIQSFELHPHLFGKFVRVDIHSHYNSEHFCPISLFRVYGTSEFEAFETENRSPSDDLDEYEYEFAVDQNSLKSENNLFKSASDAVISIVKKAAEVLVKTNPNKTEDAVGNRSHLVTNCFTLKSEFTCDKCTQSLVTKVNHLLSCRYNELMSLLSIERLRNHIISSQICANRFSMDFTTAESLGCKSVVEKQSHLVRDEKNSYLLSLLPVDYIAALCHIMNVSAASEKKSTLKSDGGDTALNLTIDRKSGDNYINVESTKKGRKIPKLGVPTDESEEKVPSVVRIKDRKIADNLEDVKTTKAENHSEETVLAVKDSEPTQIPQPPIEKDEKSESVDKASVDSNVNIFNIVEDLDAKSTEKEQVSTEEPDVTEKSLEESLSVESITAKVEEATKVKDVEAENGAWESIDTLLSETSSNENLSPPSSESNQLNNHQVPQRVHSESVFIRLSNRIKALERNMSLSGQYLEELSRRYKKQVEELQHSFAKTLSAIEEQNRRSQDKEQNLIDENVKLRRDLEELTLKVNTWIGLIACVGAVIVLQIFISWLFLRASRRKHYAILQKYEESCLSRKRIATTKKLMRRKSVEGVSGHPTPCHKTRRPSEEAMKITGSYKDLLIPEPGESANSDDAEKNWLNEMIRKKAKLRQRKISVIYNGKQQNSQLFRQESAPGDFTLSTTISTSTSTNPDDSLIPDEDYESYIPGSDLAYNEFMPEGPSGKQGKVLNGDPVNLPKISKKSSKIRRLSSPNFLKSPFGKTGNSKKLPHGPTGWEWYRSKKTENKNVVSSQENGESSSQNGNGKNKKKPPGSPKPTSKINGIGHVLPSAGSETILNSSNGSEDSLRTSGTSTTTGSLLSNDSNLVVVPVPH